VKGFKGFDKYLKCHDLQYEIGKTTTHDGKISLCKSGLHFCENPLNVLSYYSPSDSRFAEIEAQDVAKECDSDTKRVAKSLHIKAELSLSALISAGVKFILDKVDFTNAKQSNTGDRSAATNTGNSSAATNTGDSSAATNTGERSAATNTGDSSAAMNTGYSSAAMNTGESSAATNTGKYGTAISLGIEGRASGSIGNFLVLSEWEHKGCTWKRIAMGLAKVDGKKIKADTFYVLKGGKFVEFK
jgi:hypothetical protein